MKLLERGYKDQSGLQMLYGSVKLIVMTQGGKFCSAVKIVVDLNAYWASGSDMKSHAV